MAQIKRRGNILWIKYYDRIERKYKEFSTKEKATTRGYTEARRMLKVIEKNDEFDEKFGEMTKSKILSEGFDEYLQVKEHKEKTRKLYLLTKNHFLEALEDKPLDQYTIWDYKIFLKYLDKLEYTKSNIKKEDDTEKKGSRRKAPVFKPLSQNTKGIYTTHLKAVFNYFVERKYIKENFVVPVKKKLKKPESIPDSDLEAILIELKKRENIKQYYLIKFLLMTGFRVSTALDLKWKDIDFENKIISANNVKRDREFYFPISIELDKLLREIQIKSKNLYSVFDMDMYGLKFYWNIQKRMLAEGKIKKTYTMHQLRKTFITTLLEKGISINMVKDLADHKSINTTLTYYAAKNVEKMREQMENINFTEKIGDV